MVPAGLDVRNPRVNRMAKKAFVADFSLSLINRSGAYYVCRDIIEQLAPFFSLSGIGDCLGRNPAASNASCSGEPCCLSSTICALPRPSRVPVRRRKSGAMTLFFDPLYVLRTSLKREDLVLCHDIGPLTHPDLFDPGTTELYRLAYARIAVIGPGMVFVSEASKSAFQRLFADNFRFQHVIQLYVRKPLAIGDVEAPAGIRVPFLLTVAGVERRKNH